LAFHVVRPLPAALADQLHPDRLAAMVSARSAHRQPFPLPGLPRFLRRDDDSYGAPDAMILQWLPGGTFRVNASASGGAQAGRYRVDALFIAGDRPAGEVPVHGAELPQPGRRDDGPDSSDASVTTG